MLVLTEQVIFEARMHAKEGSGFAWDPGSQMHICLFIQIGNSVGIPIGKGSLHLRYWLLSIRDRQECPICLYK